MSFLFEVFLASPYAATASTSDGLNRLNLNALVTTVTEESAIAAAAKIGLSKMPKNGKRAPAATGIRIVL